MFSRRLVILVGMVALSVACSPTLPPTTVPAQPSPTFEPFKATLQAYVDETQPLRKQAAQAAENVPGKAVPATGAEESVRARQTSLADALRTTVRPNAKQGDVFTAPMATAFKADINRLFNSPQRDLMLDELAEQNTTPAVTRTPAIN
jgi:hypothetical protein